MENVDFTTSFVDWLVLDILKIDLGFCFFSQLQIQPSQTTIVDMLKDIQLL